jgi:pimeloyl-ACP methyl ester carboxylesterase
MTFSDSAKRAIVAAAFLLLTCVGGIGQTNSRYIKQGPGNQSVIVFVHGIFGDSISTWTNRNGAYWPALLTSDEFFSSYDAYVYEYTSRFVGSAFSIDEIAENMRLIFDADLVSDHKEIIFVSHSMGGLATRVYLNKNRNAAARVRLAYFYSTPTTGSELASIASLASGNPQLAKMRPMQSAEYLGDLQRQWLNINFEVPSFCAYEKQSTYGVNVVTQASASNLCNRRLDPIDADHLTIVKPASPRDTAYLALRAATQQTARKAADIKTGIIRPVDAFLSHEKAVAAQRYISAGETQVHTAFIRMNFRFLENRLNNAAYFGSFDRIDANWNGAQISAHLLSADHRAKPETFSAIVALEFPRRPSAGDTLIVSLGPVVNEHVLSEGFFKWETTVFDSPIYEVIPWTVAYAEVSCESKRPHWLTITAAELFPGRDGLYLLRATVSNATEDTQPLLSIIFSASEPHPERACEPRVPQIGRPEHRL